MNKKGNNLTGAYVGLVGALYILVGLIEAATGFGIGPRPIDAIGALFRVVGDPFNGFILCIIGSVYLKGVSAATSGDREGMSYVVGGAIMASVLLGFYVLNGFSNGLGFVLGFEDWLEWTILDDIKPGVILWLAALPSVMIARDPSWRD